MDLGVCRGDCCLGPGHGLFQAVGHHVDLAQSETSFCALAVHLHKETDAFVHGDGQRLRAAHLTQTGGDDQLTLERAPTMPACQRSQRLEGALENALGADIDPASGRHLAVHDQPGRFPLVEVLLGGPGGHDVGIGDQYAWCVFVGAEDGHRLAGLHQQRLVRFECDQARQDGIEAGPVAGGLAAAAVDDQVLRISGHLRIEIVLKHAVGCLDLPVLAGKLRAARARGWCVSWVCSPKRLCSVDAAVRFKT